MKISDVKKKSIVEIFDELYVVLSSQKINRPRLSSVYRLKLQNVETLKVEIKNFFPDEDVNVVDVAERSVRYMGVYDNIACFMVGEGNKKVFIDKKYVENALKYIKEGDSCVGQFIEEKMINILLPTFLDLCVLDVHSLDCEEFRLAKVESGTMFKVDKFIKVGDIVRIDTRSGEFVEKVKK